MSTTASADSNAAITGPDAALVDDFHIVFCMQSDVDSFAFAAWDGFNELVRDASEPIAKPYGAAWLPGETMWTAPSGG
ncbi:MAG: hypothetical protein FWD57_15545, partial [Polyangiaceae bacterium]|nr:hypothetical protein [Polyangiaceae bacterium]